MTTPITTAELRATLARLLAATATPSTLEAAIGAAAEALGRPDEDRADHLAVRLGQVLDAHLGRLEAVGGLVETVNLETAPRPGWPTYRQAFRWVYAATVELARLELAAANVRAEPGAWPAGQSWEGLGSSSRAAFMDLARDRVGIDRGTFLRVVRSGLVELEDLWEGTAEIPEPRPGLVVRLEAEDAPRVVARVEGSTVTFEDGDRVDWPELVEDTGHPWPPFATPAELARLEFQAEAAEALALELEDRARYVLNLATGRALEVNREIAAELVVIAHGLHRQAGARVGLGELQARVGLEAGPCPECHHRPAEASTTLDVVSPGAHGDAEGATAVRCYCACHGRA